MRPVVEKELLLEFVRTTGDDLIEVKTLAKLAQLWIVERIKPVASGEFVIDPWQSVPLDQCHWPSLENDSFWRLG